MQRDPKVFLMGEDVGRYGGCWFYILDIYIAPLAGAFL
jgi:pyruvate/2-oxoglutarate/acetoin dehydrogenase E1 component